MRLADAYRLDGRGRDAGDAFMAAATQAEGSTHLDLRRRAAETYLMCGYFDLGVDAMRPVLQRLSLSFPTGPFGIALATLCELVLVKLARLRFRPRPEPDLHTLALARIDACYSLGAGLLGVEDTGGRTTLILLRGLRLALQAGAERRAAFADCLVASTPPDSRAYEVDSRPVFEHTLALARQHDDKQLEAWTFTCNAMGSLYAAHGLEGIDLAKKSAEICRAAGISAGITVFGAERALQIACMMCGRMQELKEAAREQSRRARARSDLHAFTGARVYAALAMLADGDADRAVAELIETIDSWSTGEHWRRLRQVSGLWPNAAHALMFLPWAQIYRGDAASGWRELERQWPALRQQGYLRTPSWCIFLNLSRGLAALATARAAPEAHERASFIRDARRCMRVLRRARKVDAALPFSRLLEAGLAALADDLPKARVCLQAAAKGLDALDMELFAGSARHRLGQLLGGDEGAHLQQRAEARMRALGVAEPARWAAMYTPGFEPAPQEPRAGA
jgi:hypothetical protein